MVGVAPSVGVVIPTHNRPELMRRSLAAVLDQEYDGPLEVLVVFDRCEVDRSIERTDDPRRVVRAIPNTRTPGLCGSRNTGVLALDTDLVAFCDDDDVWLPGKLAAQVSALVSDPKAEFAATSMAVTFDGTRSVRLAGTSAVTHDDLLRSRMAMLHSSSFLMWRRALVDDIGLLDEAIPGSMCEDWDLLLRAAERHPIVNVDEPLIDVLWGRTSYFSQQWQMKVDALEFMLDRHPQIRDSKVGYARVCGQIAFAYAALGNRGKAVRWALTGIRTRAVEPRDYLALLVATRLMTAQRVLWLLHRRGRGV
jgi:glycosyltransferase involved in cell wall biosynthesis